MSMRRPPPSSRTEAITRLVPFRRMDSGSPSIRCGITIRLIYLSCVRTDRTCGRLQRTLNPTGSPNGNHSRKLKGSWQYHRRGVMKKLVFILVVVSILSGCSGLPSIPFLQTAVPQGSRGLPQPTVNPVFPGSVEHAGLVRSQYAGAHKHSIHRDAPCDGHTTATFTATIRPTITLEPLDPIFFTPSPNLFLVVQRSTDQSGLGKYLRRCALHQIYRQRPATCSGCDT